MMESVQLQARQTSNFKALEKEYRAALEDVDLFSLHGKEKRHVALLYNNLGHSKYMQVDFDNAVIDYTKAIELDDSLAVAYYNRGTIHYRMGYFEEAYKDFRKAAELESNNGEFINGLKACEKSITSSKK